MAWSATEKKWAEEMLRAYYGGMGVAGITAQDMETLVFGADEADRRAVATAFAQSVIKPRLEASLTALDDQTTLVEAEIAEIPVS